MKFSRRIPLCSQSNLQSLNRIERHLRQRNIQPKRQDNLVEAQLFSWTELFSSSDADRLSWNSLHLERRDSALHLRLKYNWRLQAIAQFSMSVFVTAFMNRFGSRDAVLPMLVSMNAALVVASFIWARIYAGKLAGEIATAASTSGPSDVWFQTA